MKKNRYLYLANNLRKTVSDSQIVNWLELLEKEGIIFDIIIIPPGLKSFIGEFRNKKKKFREIDKILTGKKYQLIVVKTFPFINDLYLFLSLFFLIFIDALFGKKIYIHTRTSSFFRPLKWLQASLKKVFIVYDSRGASAEKHHLKADVTAEKELLYQKTLKQQIMQAKAADRVLCVSNKLKQYHLEKDVSLSPEKLSVIPGCADEEKFYYDKDLRKNIRQKLKISDKTAFLYSGALDKEWQIPDFVFSVFSLISKKISNSYFIFLTPNGKIVKKYVAKFGINEDLIFTKFASFLEINGFLNAADAGVMFREDAVTNNVASPTKFAEYLMAGLPVIISEKIGDFSEFVAKNNVGIVLHNDLKELDRKLDQIDVFGFDRDHISTLGKSNYSKQTHIGKLLKIFKNS